MCAAPHEFATQLSRNTVVIADTAGRRDLMGILALLLSTDLEVESTTVLPASPSAEKSPSRATPDASERRA